MYNKSTDDQGYYYIHTFQPPEFKIRDTALTYFSDSPR